MLNKNSVNSSIVLTNKKLRESANRILNELKKETKGFKLSQRKIQEIFVEKIKTEISKAVLEVLKKHPELILNCRVYDAFKQYSIGTALTLIPWKNEYNEFIVAYEGEAGAYN